MDPTYDPSAFEERWYPIWEDAGVFRPEVHPEGEPFCMVIPPPNVTGRLHMGHALNHTLYDAIIRRKRMQGFAALWVPGTDHAGIATQNVVERDLADEGISRHDLGREAFVEQVWEWKRRYGGTITAQMRRLGSSVDWSRERFTMDEGLSAAVREVFVRLYEEDLVYRGHRIINWCPRCGTALAEIEVDYEDVDGELAHLAYPLADGSGELVVATTRTETMLGDVAVAVHPDDERYRHLVGRTLRLPLVGREIPIVADDHVDPGFGSGAVKVTPAHDPNDFAIAERHGLPSVVVLDPDARVNDEGGVFAGLDRFEARRAVQQALGDLGLLRGVEAHRHSVGHCYRCHTVVEPYLSDQWFVQVRPLTVPAIEAVRDGESRFVPERWQNSYFHWMENLRDWTISRQIWWGHRIPAWYCAACGDAEAPRILVSRTDLVVCPDCGGEVYQDPDVLDTWFSSALWPFTTLGWPEQTDDLERFYPNQALVTGFDIIYFWVARMMQMGIHFMGRAPFPDIVIHGLVRDPDGRKMSKSLGNALDPLEVIAEYGADPLRLALLQAAAPGHDVPLDMEWVAGTRRFGNKVWNAARFVLHHLGEGSVPPEGGYPADPGPVDAWILSRLGAVTGAFDDLADHYRFSDAYAQLYAFAWSEVFDWYLEMAKVGLRSGAGGTTAATLGVVFRDILKLLHPAMPFLTEELWSHLVGHGLLAVAPWPTPPEVGAPEGVEALRDLVSAVRAFKSQHGLAPRASVVVLVGGSVPDWWADQAEALAAVTLTTTPGDPGPGHTRLLVAGLDAFVPLVGLIDVAAERTRLARAIDETESDAGRAAAKLANPSFVQRAPHDVVEKERSKQAEFAARLEQLRAQLAELG
jgi:valyl-tRNA synthetase